MTEIMPVPRNLNFTVLPAGGLWGAFLRFTVRYDSSCAGWNTSAAMWDSASSDAPLSVVRL